MTLLIAMAIGTTLVVWLVITSRVAKAGTIDLGRMSPQWMAELKSNNGSWRR